MRVDGGVARSADELLVLAVRDVREGVGVAVLLAEAHVDEVEGVGVVLEAHEEVVGLDVAVEVVVRVVVLDAVQQLDGQHRHRLQTEFTTAYCDDATGG